MRTDLCSDVAVEDAPIAQPSEVTRYHAVDSVRATAMLLGVVYHTLLFGAFVGGAGPGAPGLNEAARWLQDWLHSFRMPLFFLISGFFGRMMFHRYSSGEYLWRRWSRIGTPLIIGLFTFVPAYVLTRDLTMGAPPMARPMPPVPGIASVTDRPPFGDPHARTSGAMQKRGDAPPFAESRPGLRPGPGLPRPFGLSANRIADGLFGSYARFFQLNHLWFLWYLLLFVAVAPVVAIVIGEMLPGRMCDRLGRRVIEVGLAPALLGLLLTPALMMTPTRMGWSLGLSPAIFRAFPDFLLNLEDDMPFYFVFFLAGWWLHRQRGTMPRLASTWPQNAALGFIAFIAAMSLSATYAHQSEMPNYGLLRAAGCALYCLGSAATSCAFLGVFLRYLDKPVRGWRYLADTALWVYLVHQPLVLVGLALFKPLNLSWWLQAAIVSLLSVAAALVAYEAVVRRTPLARLFGPSIRTPLRRESRAA